MDDEPMWYVDRVVAPTLGSVITTPETANEFAIKVAFADEGSSNSDTDKIMARMDAMTMKMNAHYKEFQSHSKQPNPDHNDDDTPMSHEEEAKFMQTFRRALFYNDYHDHAFMDLKTKLERITKNHQASIQNLEAKFNKFADKQSGRPSGSLPSNTQHYPKADLGASINLMPYSLYAKLSLETLKPTKMSILLFSKMEEDGKVPLILGRPFLHITDAVIRIKQKQLNLGVGTERMTFHMDFAMKHSYSNDDTCFSIDIIDEILEEYFDALLDEGSKILHFIEGTILEEKLFAEFDEFIAMTAEENSESEFDIKEPPFEKIIFNTDYKIKTSFEEPPTDLELKPLPDNLEYVFLEEPSL
ncbi:hypothetical protein Tco_1079378 [Tanacetum coccineum]|uniref:Reverse transcriptase domain-containing protein n=1 Tax=Tanacetum coccineum TaxID=301880 RepID=A0ABQ5HTP6_9ASTR